MATTTSSSATYTSLTFISPKEPLSVTRSPLPPPTNAPLGSIIIKVLATHVLPYIKAVQTGQLPYVLTPPIVPSATCIGRIHASPPDAVDPSVRTPGQLVLADMTIRGRDSPTPDGTGHIVLQGLHAGQDTKLMEQWKQGSWAQYAVFPLENIFPLDERLLLGDHPGKGLGYNIEDLLFLPIAQVPMGGLRRLDVRPGESVIICPASGRFGGAAVHVAVALGARVIAAGRNQAKLDEVVSTLKHTGRVSVVTLDGDTERDANKLREAAGGEGADCYVDFSPPASTGSTHPTTCFSALRPGGRVVLNGGRFDVVAPSYFDMMLKNLSICGQYMYSRADTLQLIRMAESGLLPLGRKAGVETVGRFGLEQFQEALDLAEKEAGWGKQVVLAP